MTFVTDLEYSLLLLLLYIIIRSTARNYFADERGRGAGLLTIFMGTIIFLFVQRTIGIIIIVLGLALLLIPERNDSLKETN
jgi:hypothetical protein